MDGKNIEFKVELPRRVSVEMIERADGFISIYVGSYQLWAVKGQQVKYLRSAIDDAKTPGAKLAAILGMAEDAAVDAARDNRA